MDGKINYSCMKMGLIHDLGESIIGDITPHDNVSTEDKHTMERVFYPILSNF
jgi:putative hydrolase of HD superfamily